MDMMKRLLAYWDDINVKKAAAVEPEIVKPKRGRPAKK
jgi:hypothetical protein